MNEGSAKAPSIAIAGLLAAAALVCVEAALGGLAELFRISEPPARAVIASFVGGAGVLIGGIAAAVTGVARRLSGRPAAAAVVACSAAFAFATGFFLADLFRGPRARLLPLAAAYSWVLGAAAGAALFAYLRLARSRPRAAAVALLIAAMAAATLDARVLPGLYQPFHAWLEVFTLASVALAAAMLAPRRPRTATVGLTVFAALLVAGGTTAALALRRDPALADEVRRRSVAVGRLVPLPAPEEPGPPTGAEPADPTFEAKRIAANLHEEVVIASAPRPSILLVTVDALRFDHGPGSARGPEITPLLDRWAAGGAVFTRAYSASVATFPSCQTMLTGRYPDTWLKSELLPPAKVLPAELKRLGYATFFLTGFAIVDPRDQRWMPELEGAYDEITPNLGTAQLAARVRALAESHEGPWFAWIHPGEVHYPYAGDHGVAADGPVEARYAAACRYVDGILGPLFESMPSDAWVILSADHGEDLPHEHGFSFHGTTLFEGAIHVPLVVRGPRARRARIDDPVSLVDIFPTILGMAGVGRPPPSDGLSLFPAITSDASYLSRRDAVFAERRLGNDLHRVANPMRAMISGPFKTIIHETTRGLEIYDVIADPLEANNLALTRPDLSSELRARSRARFESRMRGWTKAGEASSVAYDPGLHDDPREVLTLTTSPDPRVSRTATRDLTRSPHPSLEPEFTRLTGAADAVVRAWAAIGLGRLAGPGKPWPCEHALLGPDDAAREAALDILVKTPLPEAAPSLIAVVDPKSPSSTSKAVVGLNAIGRREGILFAEAAFSETDPHLPGVNNIVVHLGAQPRPESPSLLERACDRFLGDQTFVVCLVSVSPKLPSGQVLRSLERASELHAAAAGEVAARRNAIRDAMDRIRARYDAGVPARIEEGVFEAAWEILPGVNFVCPPHGALDPAEWSEPAATAAAGVPRSERFGVNLPRVAGSATRGVLQLYSLRAGTVGISVDGAPAHEASFEPGATAIAFPMPAPEAGHPRRRIEVLVRGPSPGSFGVRELLMLP